MSPGRKFTETIGPAATEGTVLAPHITRRNGFLALAAGLTTATALVAAPASAAQPAASGPQHKDCVSTQVTERTVATEPEGPAGPPLESVGDGATYFDNIS